MIKKITNPVVLGKIGSAYGLYGWLKIFSSTENTKKIFEYQPWFIHNNNQWWHINLENWKGYKKDLIIKIKGINDRNTANRLTNLEIVIEYSQLPKLQNGDYYWRDIINCQIININGYYLGQIVNIIETGSNDVIVVQENKRDKCNIKKHLIPFLDGKVIKNVNLKNKIITVDWCPLFD
ncbi:Ribosome maturation factor RimM [Candidatus Profftia lariciata]|uniref:ribosome maturation factor RimM n=1 Tax=Candidatus Profftia lariciata TaxID=1987921 RepID=UPI001D00DDBD|nr:ribosome maturation factor RimM [Candidatus Profftia lariciata]UDG81286.1 Ribosome maturation factor RimM [Candidatus Profftia lariciata]